MRKAPYPDAICAGCGIKHGKARNACSTWSLGECGWCGLKGVPVTEPRDYGYPLAPSGVESAGEGGGL